MRTYVSTMGFHETRVTRPLHRHGIRNGDELVLLRPTAETDSNRGADAIDYVEDMVHEIAPEAGVTVERVDESAFDTAVLQCSDALRSASGDLIVNFGGGPREIFLPLTVAAVVHSDEIDATLQYTDIEQSVREWSVPNLISSVPENARPTLTAIADTEGEISIPELQDTLEASKSTVSRHVSDLEESGLVTTEMRGKTKFVGARLAGQLQLRTAGW